MNSGLLGGNIHFPGSMQECINIEVPVPDVELEGFNGKYIIVKIPGGFEKTARTNNKNLRMPIFVAPGTSGTLATQIGPQISLCVPDSCSDTQIKRGLEKNLCQNM